MPAAARRGNEQRHVQRRHTGRIPRPSPEAPGLEDLCQLHWSYNVGLDNAPAIFIANVEDNATISGVLTAQPGARGGGGVAAAAHTPAYVIKVSAQQDGTFTVTNTRNGFAKTYKPRP